jgi:uncharacterized protein
VEQRPRAERTGRSRVVNTYPCPCGSVIAVPRDWARGWSAAPVRHGVSAIRSGQRHTLGLVFHDAA